MRGKLLTGIAIAVILIMIGFFGTRLLVNIGKTPMPKCSRITTAVTYATSLMERYRNRPFFQLDYDNVQDDSRSPFISEVAVERVEADMARIVVTVYWDEARAPDQCVKLATFVTRQDPIPEEDPEP